MAAQSKPFQARTAALTNRLQDISADELSQKIDRTAAVRCIPKPARIPADEGVADATRQHRSPIDLRSQAPRSMPVHTAGAASGSFSERIVRPEGRLQTYWTAVEAIGDPVLPHERDANRFITGEGREHQ